MDESANTIVNTTLEERCVVLSETVVSRLGHFRYKIPLPSPGDLAVAFSATRGLASNSIVKFQSEHRLLHLGRRANTLNTQIHSCMLPLEGARGAAGAGGAAGVAGAAGAAGAADVASYLYLQGDNRYILFLFLFFFDLFLFSSVSSLFNFQSLFLA